MIDFKRELQDMKPIKLDSDDSTDLNISVDILYSIAQYNKAIECINMKNVELAVICLKKSLHVNQNFHEAMKLIGLCYVNTGKYLKARQVFKKLAQKDVYHRMQVNEYIKAIDGISHGSKPLSAFTYKLSSKQIVILAAGVIVIAVSVSAFVFRDNIGSVFGKSHRSENVISMNNEISKSNETSKSNVSSKNNEISTNDETSTNNVSSKNEAGSLSNKIAGENYEITAKYAKLSEDYKNLQKNLDETKSELDKYKNRSQNTDKLFEAKTLYESRKYEAAIDNLLAMKKTPLDDETKKEFDRLWKIVVIPGVVWDIYDEGNKLYKENRYQDALPKLIKVEECEQNLSLMPYILYQIGKCYKQLNDNTNALTYCQKVIDNYPKSQYTQLAINMKNDLSSKR